MPSVTSWLTCTLRENWKRNRVVMKNKLWRRKLVVCFRKSEKRWVKFVFESWIRLMRHWSWLHVVLKVPLWTFLKWWLSWVNRLSRVTVCLMDFRIDHYRISPKCPKRRSPRVLLEILFSVVCLRQNSCSTLFPEEKVWLIPLSRLPRLVTCRVVLWSPLKICLRCTTTPSETRPTVSCSSLMEVMVWILWIWKVTPSQWTSTVNGTMHTTSHTTKKRPTYFHSRSWMWSIQFWLLWKTN